MGSSPCRNCTTTTYHYYQNQKKKTKEAKNTPTHTVWQKGQPNRGYPRPRQRVPLPLGRRRGSSWSSRAVQTHCRRGGHRVRVPVCCLFRTLLRRTRAGHARNLGRYQQRAGSPGEKVSLFLQSYLCSFSVCHFCFAVLFVLFSLWGREFLTRVKELTS